MSQDELISNIFTQLMSDLINEKPRDVATLRKQNTVTATELGTAIFEYLDGTYWSRITAYVDARVAEAIGTRFNDIELRLSNAEGAVLVAQRAAADAIAASATTTTTTAPPTPAI